MKSMLKHAYCIICHNEPKVLSALVRMIDDERNDIFIMADKKIDISIYKDIKTVKAGLYWTEQRIDVRWGDISLIQAEYAVFEAAKSHGPYNRYHLLSGVDLPIKSQDYIHQFFDKYRDIECIGYAQGEYNKADLIAKTRHYTFFLRYARVKNTLLRKLASNMSRTIVRLQKLIHFERKYPYETIKKGAEWVSITDNLCNYILSKKKEVLHTFRYISCADEIYKQTLVWNSDFRSSIFNPDDEYKSCLRAIDWNRGGPYCWGTGGGILTLPCYKTVKPFSQESSHTKNCGLFMR